jgi:magnesium transporter
MRTMMRSEEDLQRQLADITELLDRHRILELLAHRQEGPRRDLVAQMQHRQNLTELNKHLRALHAADIAYVLESLPPEDRATVWEQALDAQAALAFVELSDPVRLAIAGSTPRERLVGLLVSLDLEDLAAVSESAPGEVLNEVSSRLASAERSVFDDQVQFPEEVSGIT